MPRHTLTLALVAAGLFSATFMASAVQTAEAGCTRTIVNKSRLTALVRRDEGRWVRIGPGQSQSITYHRSGEIDVSLNCGRGRPGDSPEDASFHINLGVTAIIDRCYVELGSGFAEEQFGPGTLATEDTAPITVNVPRQGDVVIGPFLRDLCAKN